MLTKTTCAIRRDQRASVTGVLPRDAFTLIELLVVIALLAFFATLLVPASAHIRPNSQAIQCLNNLRQLANAWKMYADDNGSRIVSAYPAYGAYTTTWCGGNAASGGLPSSYVYSGADPAGIQAGLLWPYTKTLGSLSLPDRSSYRGQCWAPCAIRGKAYSAQHLDEFLPGRYQPWRKP